MRAFFVIDGIDGAGKSTQAALLAEALERRGRTVERVRDPGGTPLSDRIRALLLEKDTGLAPASEMCLYAAARAQLVRERILPALEAGRVVVADRYSWSTFAYQGHGRGLPLDQIGQLEDIACGEVRPAHTFVLDLDPAARLQRLWQKGLPPDRLELEGEAFFRKVREGFLSLARSQPEKSTVLDAARPSGEIHHAILARVDALLAASGAG